MIQFTVRGTINHEPVTHTAVTAADALTAVTAITAIDPAAEVDYANKAVAVAMDVLRTIDQTTPLSGNGYVTMKYEYHSDEVRKSVAALRNAGGRPEDIIEAVRPHCEVCALGACLLAAARVGAARVTDVVGPSGSLIGVDEFHVRDSLRDTFSDRTMCLIESAFEGQTFVGAVRDFRTFGVRSTDELRSHPDLRAAAKIGITVRSRYPNCSRAERHLVSRETLRLVMQNVVENCGDFDPYQVLAAFGT